MGFKLDIVWYGSKTILLFAVTALGVSSWQLTADSQQLAANSWQPTAGSQQLAAKAPHVNEQSPQD